MIFTVKPQAPTVSLTSSTDVQGDTVTLTCNPVGGTPPGAVAYAWYKDGSAVSSETASTLSFSAAAFTDSGDYKCTVSNDGAVSAQSTSAYSLGSELETLYLLAVNRNCFMVHVRQFIWNLQFSERKIELVCL